MRCQAEQIVLTSGTQQGLSLAARILIDPGDAAWVEDPCYRAAFDILAAAEAKIVPVAVDDQGLDVETAAARQHAPPRLVYTTPSRQYPLGMAMPLPRRLALLAWAERAGAWIIEDDYESEFQRPGRAFPSLQGLDRAGRVIYLGTFSKLLFPSLRLGYAVLPDDLGGRAIRRGAPPTDRQSSGLAQAIMTDFIVEGDFARHLKRMQAHYADRQAFLIGQVARRLGGLLDIRRVESGMYLTAWLPSGWDDRAIAAALAEIGVVALPLSALTLVAARPPRPGYRIRRPQRAGDQPRRRAHGARAGSQNWSDAFNGSGAWATPGRGRSFRRAPACPEFGADARHPDPARFRAERAQPRAPPPRARALRPRDRLRHSRCGAHVPCRLCHRRPALRHPDAVLARRRAALLARLVGEPHAAHAARGIPVCLTVSHIDGLVLARSAFRHSLNYRAVMAFGTAAMVEDEREKEKALNAFIERLYPGRTGLMRAILPQELKATALISMVIEEASAKIRDDGPLDLEADYAAPCWAGNRPDCAAPRRRAARRAGRAAQCAGTGDRPFRRGGGVR